MKMKTNNILNIYNALGVLATIELDLNTACIIAKNIKELETFKSVIDSKINSIIAEYAERDEDGNFVYTNENKTAIKILNIQDFNKKTEELLSAEIDINLNRISKDSIKNIKISPKDILPLMDILNNEV